MVDRIRDTIEEATVRSKDYADEAFEDDNLHSTMAADWQNALEAARSERNRPVEGIADEESDWSPEPGLETLTAKALLDDVPGGKR